MGKPAFDPSKPFQQVAQTQGAKPAFDPSKPFQQAPSGPGKAEAFGRGAVQGFTMDFGDELAGASESQATAPTRFAGPVGAIMDSDFIEPEKSYRQARDESRAANAAARQAHPGMYTAGQVSGAIANSVLLPGGNANTLRSAMNVGAAYGGVQGLGSSEAEDLGGMAIDTGLGIIIGAGGGMLGHGVERGVSKGIDAARPVVAAAKQKVGEKLKDLAETQAFKATGAMLKDFRSNEARGKVKELGRWLLDTGTVKAGDTVESVANKAEGRLTAAGDKLDEVYSKAQEKFASIIDKVGFDPKRDRGEILKAARKELGETEGAETAINRLSKYLDEVAERHGDLPNEQAKAAYKAEVEQYLTKLRPYMRARSEFRKAVGTAADDVDQMVLPGLADDLQRTGAQRSEVELIGQPASVVRPSPAEYTEQTFLSPLPQKPQGLFNPTRGDDLTPLAQQMALDTMNTGERTMLSHQGEIQGLDLVPREYAAVETPAVASLKGQTSMPIAPQAPARPVRPTEVRNPMSPRKTNEIKTALDERIRYSRNPMAPEPATEKAFYAARKVVAKKVDEAMDALGGDAIVAELKAANREYGSASEVTRMARDRVNRENANQMFGLTDQMAAGAGLIYGGATGDWDTALGAVAAKKLFQKYGTATIAAAADRVGRRLLQSAALKEIAASNPEVFKAAVINLTRKALEHTPQLKAVAGLEEEKPAPAPAQLRGREKWASDGFDKLLDHTGDAKAKAKLQEMRGALLKDPKAKDLLVQASDLKPGSKAMASIQSKLESKFGKGGS